MREIEYFENYQRKLYKFKSDIIHEADIPDVKLIESDLKWVFDQKIKLTSERSDPAKFL